METRAHHILIGTFTILVVAAAMLFALWLAKTSISRQYDFYDIVFTEAVTGLSQGGMVQYNGIRVGDVDQLKLDPKNPSKVLVRIRVAARTPIKIDTRAKLGLTGLTGVAFIQLTGGTPQSALLKPRGSEKIPTIEADDSALSKLLAGGEDIVTKVSDIITRASELLSSDNVERISRTLDHLDKATGAIADQRKDLRLLIQQLAEASRKLNGTLDQTQDLARTTNRLLGNNGAELLNNANQAVASLNHAAKLVDQLLADNRVALQSGMSGLADIGPAIRELRQTLQSLQTISSRFGDNPAGYLLGGERPREYTPK
ncbi:MAG: MlaD family protein [Rhodanobacteraceae bacterium]